MELTIYGEEIKVLQKLLFKIGIRSTIIQKKGKHNDGGTFTLRILDRNSLTNFNKLINFTIKRKRIILEKILKSYKREAYDGEKTKRELLTSLKERPKTVKEIALDIDKNFNTTRKHLKNLNGKQVKIIGKEIILKARSPIWALKTH